MLAAMMLGLASLAQFPPDRPAIFRGTVVETGAGRPLAGVSVRVQDGYDVPTATTDAEGKFDGIPAPGTSWFPVDGQNGPPLRIRAEDDRAWPWKTVDGRGRPRTLSEHQQRQAIEAVYERQVRSRWKGQGPGATLVVECPPVGIVEAVVRGPDGKPLTDAAIVVAPLVEFPHASAGPLHFSGRTGADGAFKLRSFEGTREFGVLAPGTGFGSTGRIEVIAGETIRPEVPPLARFARVEGRVDDALKGPGAEAFLMGRTHDDASTLFVPVDEEGRFAMTDVLPGDYTVGARRGEPAARSANVIVALAPGEVVRDVVLGPAPPPSPEAEQERQRRLRALDRDRDRTVPWVEGTVRDEQGRPLAGATVYVHVEYQGGLRAYSDFKKTTADAEGRYRFEGPLHPGMGTFSVLVAAKGRAPTIAFAPGPDESVDPAERKPARLDVAAGAKGGSLAVAVFRGGRKVPGAEVHLTPTDMRRTFNGLARTAPGVDPEAMRALAVPNTVAGADGVARFADLAPGFYEVVALTAADPNPNPNQPFDKGRPARMQSIRGGGRGVDVPPGGRVDTTVAVLGAFDPTRFRLLAPDGAPVANRTVSLGWGRGGVTSTTSINTDERGEGVFEFGLGLWTADLRYCDTELKDFPVQREPFYQAEALVPISPAVSPGGPIVLRARRRERGAIKVRLVGPDGEPARGGVMILNSQQAGTVDDQGWVRFADMPSGKYALRGYVDGSSPAPRPRYGPRRLADEELKDRATIFDREAAVETGAETIVELRSEPVGYVRATLRAPAGRSPSESMASLRSNELPGRFPTYEVSEDGAGYLFGPIPAGRWPIVVLEKIMSTPDRGRIEREVVVEPGRVVHVDVAIEARPGVERPGAGSGWSMASLGMGGIRLFDSGPDGAAITVVMADGVTPAFGARAFFILPDGREPVADGIADAAGRLTWTGFRREVRDTEEGRQEPVKEPTVLAWIPGLVGPAVATAKVGEPLRLVLPEPAGASGRVTIGGQPVAGREALIRVVAASEGRGAVDVAMGRETIADPDGRFRFAGLAPGRYVVQAARDEVWISKAVPLVVEPGKEAAAIKVDVPEPGAEIALELADRQGRPIAAGFSVRPPAGPLADLAPIAGRTDERGEAAIRGLAAGVFALAVDGDPEPHALDVPTARPGAGPLGVRVEVSRPGP